MRKGEESRKARRRDEGGDGVEQRLSIASSFSHISKTEGQMQPLFPLFSAIIVIIVIFSFANDTFHLITVRVVTTH